MAYYSDPQGYMSYQNCGNGNAFHSNSNQFNSYGYSHVVPRCHICGFEGHAPAECQQRYSSTQNCFGMNFAQEHGSYHNNYSDGWPPNQNVTYGNNNPPISSFSRSYQMQGFRCGEENQYYPQQDATSTFAPEFHQEQHQFCPQSSPLAGESSWFTELKKRQQELRDMIDSRMMQLNASLLQTSAHEPQHQPQEPVPMELIDPPQVQPPKEVFDDIEKLSLLCLEYTYSSEDDPLRLVIITEMKKIKDGRDLVDELKKIEIKMKLSNTISSLLELELSAPDVSLDICEVLAPSHEPEQTSKSPTEVAAVEEEKIAEIEKEERSQILEEQESQLDFTSDLAEDPTPITPEHEEESANEEKDLDEIQEDMHIVIQECDETGLSNPLDDMLVTDFLAIVSHYLIPLLKAEINYDLPKIDNAYSVIDIAQTQNDGSHNSRDKNLLRDACFDNSHVSQDYNCCPEYDTLPADPYHSTHVLYSYTYMIGYSIDDIVGFCPVTFTLCFCENVLRSLLVHHPLRPHSARVDIPWDPGGFVAW